MVHIGGLNPGQKILLISNANVSQEEIQKIKSEVEKNVTPEGEVKVENLERLKSGDVKDKSCYDIILSGVLSPYSITHTVEVLSYYLNLVKPQGRVVVQEIVKTGESSLRTKEELVSSLKISGLIDVSDGESLKLEDDDRKKISAFLEHDEFTLVRYEAKKSNFEMGTSTKIKLDGKVPDSVVNVWKLDNLVDDNIIDSELLLDEDDLKKPDPGSLRVCGTTGKRKACKNCSCGLADEIAAEAGDSSTIQANQSKSSCGNCYLGDAFRCSSCPYLGMPAFKPGEKISLSEVQMQADL